MGFLIHLCRFVGVVSGFVIPVVAGLYAASVGNVKKANFFLRALICWIALDRIVSPVLYALFGVVSELLWPLTFSVISVVLVVPRSHILEYGDKYTVMAIEKGDFQHLAGKLIEAIEPLKKKVEEFMCHSPKDSASEPVTIN
ncbi:uncharacterized protein BcabD6B2_14950 [Babesia caballi]|uniref:Membrane protein, putative n=1 Tax=Babesia caballi TaxID=5871 RepID=A0AAV4LQG8_BABCB|nr:membrane protein, putative [Babesia caballi]